MTIIHNPYDGTVEIVSGYVVITTKQGKEQYRLDEVERASATRRKPNGTEVAKGVAKATIGGIAGFVGGALISLGVMGVQGAVVGIASASTSEFLPKCDFTLVFRDGTTRTWTLLRDNNNFEALASQINNGNSRKPHV